jgi:hypothetical protein
MPEQTQSLGLPVHSAVEGTRLLVHSVVHFPHLVKE